MENFLGYNLLMAKTKKSDDTSAKITSTKLHRPMKDRVIGGVCAGIGEFFQIDPTIVRLIFVLITVFGGGGILLYLILWLIIPSESSGSELTKENIEKSADEIKDTAKEFAKNFKTDVRNINSRRFFGIVILIIGVILLLESFGFMDLKYVVKFFPAVIIIVLGIAILKKSE
jgi:phage shock protein PspC (stress-responsive transcriptional regulator)